MGFSKKSRLLIVLIALLIYIISPYNLLQLTAYADKGNASTIGGVQVGELTGKELKSAILKGINIWSTESLEVVGGGKTILLDPSDIQYDVDATVSQYLDLTSKSWYEFWKSKKSAHIPLQVLASDSIKQEIESVSIWQTEETYNTVMLEASNLGSHLIEATVSNYPQIDNERISLDIEDIPEGVSGISNVIALLNERVIASGEEFSFNTETQIIEGMMNQNAANFVASLLYRGALKVNGQIVERHSQGKVTEYSEHGVEVLVSNSLKRDFRFINKLDDIMLKMVQEDGRLKVEFYASTAEETATIQVSQDKVITPRTITRFSNDLAIGEQIIEQEGDAGLRVTVFRTVASLGVEEVVSKDFYAPVNRIVIKSSRQPVITENSDATSGVDGASSAPDLTNSTGSNGLSEGISSGDNNQENVDENGNYILPKGSYYDKSGNLVTGSK